MNLSYWEKKSWFSNIDFCVVGSGIVGLSCALQLRKDFPHSNILVLERGVLPNGASTKNAGFACYGSMSEILSDLEHHSQTEVLQLVRARFEGLKLLRGTLGDQSIGFKQHGGYEVFLKEDKDLFENCIEQLDFVNEVLEPVFGKNGFEISPNIFGFRKSLNKLIFNPNEGQIDTGLMMKSLISKARSNGIEIMTGIEVQGFSGGKDSAIVNLKDFSFKTNQLFIATNAFAGQFFKLDLKPARNQVMITNPISDLHIKGVFHLNKGYYYFRNINNRILLGGGRHLNLKGETTTEFGTTRPIQESLEELLKTVILPKEKCTVEMIWSGILGVGDQKSPIVKSVEDRIHCAVRLGGMGIAIGSKVGYDLARLI
jgi:glycine/D-amino acid oxidase-like deaminating enzyme